MIEYQARCRKCGCINSRLLLDETDGLFECEVCRTVNRVRPRIIVSRSGKIPVKVKLPARKRAGERNVR